jgi:hypothetical protein
MNKKSIIALAVIFLFSVYGSGYSAPMDWLKGALNKASSTKLSDTYIGAGLK